MTKPKYIISGTLATVGLAIIIGIGVIIWPFAKDLIRERLNRLKFEPVAWQSSSSLTNAIRIRMVDDLLQKHQFNGIDHQEITNILGKPDQTNNFGNWNIIYRLGPERGFISIDDEWLVFRLDGRGKVAEYRIVTD